LEASLGAIGPRVTLRDYYLRRGLQISSAYRLHPNVEAMLVWRGERHEPLHTSSDFSFWNSDEALRPNTAAADGRLNAIVVGASVDGRGFERESLEAT